MKHEIQENLILQVHELTGGTIIEFAAKVHNQGKPPTFTAEQDALIRAGGKYRDHARALGMSDSTIARRAKDLSVEHLYMSQGPRRPATFGVEVIGVSVMDGTTIRFPTVRDAVEGFNTMFRSEGVQTTRNNLSKTLAGISKHCAGYVWRYVNEFDPAEVGQIRKELRGTVYFQRLERRAAQ